ncbi:NAD-dependent epimerase/dehydratase family protein [Pelagibacterales bacterium SAG-MED41]|mgnify:CR=1 FL=1|nr:NAD-dependent epimerase/dehydratase family protein [Pelagibacterales bacterium SAG-MED41]|tara:strand:- start:3799 stop:4848 length:1050 start_codon:yes stop_codon:yes gene_type:complete
MSIALITGSCGLVGSESALFFSKKGFDIIGIDNNARKFFFGKDGDISWIKNKLNKNIRTYKHYNIDIRNYELLKKVFKKCKKKISIIIHCAAQPSHDWAKNNAFIDFDINAKGTLNLLELTKNYCPEAPFIFMSTNKVYGDNPNFLPLVEKKTRWEINPKHKFRNGINESMSIDDCTHSLFGASKTYADIITQEYSKNIGLKTACFRAGCITGPNHSGAKLHGFLSYLVKASIRQRKYTLIGYKGKQVRDNIHSYDLVNCFWEFYKKPQPGKIYNTGGGRFSNCSVLEAINIVEDFMNVEIKKKFIKHNRVGDHIWYISDMKRFKKDYPKWKQKYSIKKIINELIENFS